MVTRCPVVVEHEPVVENCANHGRDRDAKVVGGRDSNSVVSEDA